MPPHQADCGNACSQQDAPARKDKRHRCRPGAAGAHPQSQHPQKLPGKSAECAGFMKRHGQAGEFHGRVIKPQPQAELGQEPKPQAGAHHRTPAAAQPMGQYPRAGQHEQDVHRQNVQQRRLVDQQQARCQGRHRMRQVVNSQILHCRLVNAQPDSRDHRKQKQQGSPVPGIDLERAPPERQAHGIDALAVGHLAVHHARHVGRQQDKTLGGGDIAERLAQRGAQPGRQVGQGHQHQHQAAQRVKLPAPGHDAPLAGSRKLSATKIFMSG